MDMDGPIFEGDVEERRHVTAGDEAAITLLAVVEGGKHVAIDPTTGRITVDLACADAFQVICDADRHMIRVLERGGGQSLVVVMCSHLRAHTTSLTKELTAAIGVDFESLLDADAFPLAKELERGVAHSKVIAVMRACLRGLKAGYGKALQKQFRIPGVESRHMLETVSVAALLNPAVARGCFAAGGFEAAVQTLRSLYDRAAHRFVHRAPRRGLAAACRALRVPVQRSSAGCR